MTSNPGCSAKSTADPGSDSAPDSTARRSEDPTAWNPLVPVIDRRLEQLLASPPAHCQRLDAAMRYSLLSPGKRVRPALVMLVLEDFGADPQAGLDFGCALEMVHCASLILDDLPCMDDAGTRRGRPTLHRTVGEDLAILASVALLNRAYGVVAESAGLSDADRGWLVTELSRAIGTAGLVSGQSRDLRDRVSDASREELESINHQKTGVLFSLAINGAARLAGLDASRRQVMARFADRLGQAFQAADDLLDACSTVQDAGKDVGQDHGRAGLVEALGAPEAQDLLERHLAEAFDALEGCSPGGRVEAFVRMLFSRLA